MFASGHFPTSSYACQNVYESGIWWNSVVFFFPCALNCARGVGQCSTGNKWMRLFRVLVLKSSPQKRKKEKKNGTDVRWVCSRLIPVGFFVACDVCEANISLFDALCGCHLTLNQILYKDGYISNCISKIKLDCSLSMNCIITMDMCRFFSNNVFM